MDNLKVNEQGKTVIIITSDNYDIKEAFQLATEKALDIFAHQEGFRPYEFEIVHAETKLSIIGSGDTPEKEYTYKFFINICRF